MMDEEKSAALVQTICDAWNIARELGIDIEREMNLVCSKVVRVCADEDHKFMKASFAPLTKSVQRSPSHLDVKMAEKNC